MTNFDAIDHDTLSIVTGGHHDKPAAPAAKPPAATRPDEAQLLMQVCRELDRGSVALREAAPASSRTLKGLADECWKGVRGQ